MTFRKKVYHTLEHSASGRRGLSLYINVFLVMVIVLNSIAIILHTIPEISKNQFYDKIFFDFELFSVVIFSIEYLMRIWSCVENPNSKIGFKGRLAYVSSFWGIIDLLGIMPFYLTLFASDWGIIRMLRIFRLFRLFRVTRYSQALKVITDVVKETKEELILSFSFILFTLLIGSSAMYFIEHNVQPKKFSSIPASLWWGVITMTTTGYGDMYPITIFGKIIGGIFSILGVALFGLPTGILASGFIDQFRKEKEAKETLCPHCGKTIEKHKH